MAHYLFQVAYTPEALKKLIAKPENRGEVVRKSIEKLGGKVLGTWLCFGEYDTVAVFEMPDHVSAAAFALAVGAGGSCKAMKTTPLMSTEDGVAALKKAGSSDYRPVGN
jgi:uncharacterized protein with GYD domain